jgi:hypothetical protein
MRFFVPATTAAIVSLLFWGCPTAIPWLVIAILVGEAVDALSWRALTHICQKVEKVFSPSSADSDSPATVVLISCVCRTVAAGLHVIPAMESARPSIDSGSVLESINRRCFPHSAAATDRCASLQRPLVNRFLLPAIAEAQPVESTAIAVRNPVRHFEDDQAAESLPCQVLKFWHGPGLYHVQGLIGVI